MSAKESLSFLKILVSDLGLDDDEVYGWITDIADALDERERLLAAATELCAWVEGRIGLGGGEWLLSQAPALQRVFNLARAAIAKSTGVPEFRSRKY